jgi:hypothetical protein
LAEHGLESWLAETLDTTAKVIAGALNVLGINRVIITGALTELPGFVFERLSTEIQKGALWARFGKVICQSAPHRRAAGLVAVGIDRLILPDNAAVQGSRFKVQSSKFKVQGSPVQPDNQPVTPYHDNTRHHHRHPRILSRPPR